MDLDDLRAQLRLHGRSQAALARKLKFADPSYVSKILAGKRDIKAREMEGIREYLRSTDPEGREPHIDNSPDMPEADSAQAYVAVEVLPTFAGMGGGGTGDADRETALISRRLVQDELRAKPTDLLVINVRGNSMEPLFRHGDQLIVDCRDKNPLQPGPFALLYEDGYVVKNVSFSQKRTKVRVSSSNPEFPPEEYNPDEIRIMGRPVWFARRL